MPDSLMRRGQSLSINRSLELVVLDLTSRDVTLGIRPRDSASDDLVSLVYNSLRNCNGYWHFRDGNIMLVVSAGAGQILNIDDSVFLSAVPLSGTTARVSRTENAC